MPMETAAKPGAMTSEHKALKNNSMWGVIALILGFLTANLGGLIDQLAGGDPASHWFKIGGAVIAVAGVLQQILGALGYTNARQNIKIAAIKNGG